MNLVSVMMCGLRAVRVPVLVGLVWMGVLLLAMSPYWRDLGSDPVFHPWAETHWSIRLVIQSGAVVFTAYLLGIFAVGVSRDVSRLVGRRLRRALFERSESERRLWVGLWQFWEWVYPTLAVSEVITTRVLSDTLGRHDHGLLRSLVPNSLLDAELDLAALQLSNDFPNQFQQYDRRVAEADLRRGLALPVCGLLLTLGVMTHSVVLAPALTVLGIALPLYLSAQAHRKHHEAERYIFAAIGMSWTSTPALTGIRMQLNEIDQWPTHEDRKLSAKATAIVSVVIETLEGSNLTRYLSGLRHPSRARILQAYLRKEALSKVYGNGRGVGHGGQPMTVEGRHRAP